MSVQTSKHWMGHLKRAPSYLCWNYMFDQKPFEVQLLYSNTLKMSTFLSHFSVQKLTSVSLLWHILNNEINSLINHYLYSIKFSRKTKMKFWMMKIDIKIHITTTSCDMFFSCIFRAKDDKSFFSSFRRETRFEYSKRCDVINRLSRSINRINKNPTGIFLNLKNERMCTTEHQGFRIRSC